MKKIILFSLLMLPVNSINSYECQPEHGNETEVKSDSLLSKTWQLLGEVVLNFPNQMKELQKLRKDNPELYHQLRDQHLKLEKMRQELRIKKQSKIQGRNPSKNPKSFGECGLSFSIMQLPLFGTYSEESERERNDSISQT